jgi:hypothetical protein
MRNVTRLGCAVVMSIHQPTSRQFRQFDKVVALSCTGRLLYMGAPMEAVHHLVEATGMAAPRFPAGSDFGLDPDVDLQVLAEVEAEEEAARVAAVAAADAAPPSPLSTAAPLASDGAAGVLSSAAAPAPYSTYVVLQRPPRPPRSAQHGDGIDVVVDDVAPSKPRGDSHGSHGGGSSRASSVGGDGDDVLSAARSAVADAAGGNDGDAGTAPYDSLLVQAKGRGDGGGGYGDENDEGVMVNPAELLLDVAAERNPDKLSTLAVAFRSTMRWRETLTRIRVVARETAVLDAQLSEDIVGVVRRTALGRGLQYLLLWVAKFLLLCNRGVFVMIRNPLLLLMQVRGVLH